jgi:hypothetical protein
MALSPLICLVLLVAVVTSNVLVKKSFQPEIFVATQDNTVEIVVYNLGNSPVYEVEVRDDNWGEGWNVKSGQSVVKVDSIQGRSNYTHSYVVTPTLPVASTYVEPAVVSYLSDDNPDELSKVLSTTSFSKVYRSTYYSRIHYSTPLDWSIIIFFAVTTTLPSFLTWFYYHSNYENGVKKQQKKQPQIEAK